MEPTDTNLRAWEEAHKRIRRSSTRGSRTLPKPVRERLPDVGGRHLLHLACGAGRETAALIGRLAVTTPSVMGRLVSIDACAIPLKTSAAMYSLCEVSPRITTPIQMMASYLLLSAARRAAIGISNESGTRMIVMASVEAPRRSSASSAPLIKRLTTKSFQRLAMIPTRRTSRSPSSTP